MPFFDSHAHLDDSKFNEDRKQVINDCIKENGAKFVTVGYSLQSSKKAIELANNYDIYATIGISPNDIPQKEDKLWKELDEMEKLVKTNIDSKRFLAIGEI